MQNEILRKNPNAHVRVFAVWLPALSGDSAQGWDPEVLNDPRVANYWDPSEAVSLWFGQHVIHTQGIVWDHCILFGPDAAWNDVPGPALGDGGDVITVADQLRSQMRPFLH